ncbi:MAG: hypothetical protein IT371_05320 [Deltaproteobacteria bacterium]|nr:hypothetical protein [Deltaproteobacteria bacterium]
MALRPTTRLASPSHALNLPRRSGASLALALLAACSADGADNEAGYVALPHGFELAWKLLPHRLSRAELRLLPPTGAAPPQLATQQNGGSFGAIDRYGAQLDYALLVADGLRVAHGTTTLELAPGQTDADAEVTVGLPSHAPAGPVFAVLRGFRISTADYATPPPWNDRYDPAQGYTTTGLALRLGPARHEAERAHFTVHASFRLAPCDRSDPARQDDMNGTIPLARRWITVEHTLVALAEGQLTRGAHGYFSSYPAFAQNGVHVVDPPPRERSETLRGAPGWPRALALLQGFDFRINDPGDKAASCTIQQREECAGPGRYLRTLRARVVGRSYDATSGLAQLEHDHAFHNDAPDGSKLLEEGNVCGRLRAETLLLQLPATARLREGLAARASDLKSGERTTSPVEVCRELPAPAPCP